MDTKLGNVALSPEQVSNIKLITHPKILGVTYWQGGGVVLVSKETLSDSEIDEVKVQLLALPKVFTRTQKETDRATEKGALMTKLGLTKQELKTMADLIRNGNDE